jgi:hypothetical protein
MQRQTVELKAAPLLFIILEQINLVSRLIWPQATTTFDELN